MPLGTFITTATVGLAATSYDSVTHGLSTTPDMIWATLKGTNHGDITSSATPVFAATGGNSASLTCYNLGLNAGTWTWCAAFFHSIIR